MTATQVFYRFLKEELSIDGYLYFQRLIRGEEVGNWRKTRLIRKKNPLGSKTFVDDYLRRGDGRTLCGYMMNLLRWEEPALTYRMNCNKDYSDRKDIWQWDKYTERFYRQYYTKLWHKFLRKYIQDCDKRIYHGLVPDYKLKEQ